MRGLALPAVLAAARPTVAVAQQGGSAFAFRLGVLANDAAIITERHGVFVMADHSSNGYLCEPNPGLDTAGIRYGYRV